jgi:hypothetical protein
MDALRYEKDRREGEKISVADALIDQYEKTGLVIVNESMIGAPAGTHDQHSPALEIQEMHRKLGILLPQLQTLVTSSGIGEERGALTMLYQELAFAHQDLSAIASIASQAPNENFTPAIQHYNRLYDEVMSVLDPYTGTTRQVGGFGPYQLKGTALQDNEK